MIDDEGRQREGGQKEGEAQDSEAQGAVQGSGCLKYGAAGAQWLGNLAGFTFPRALNNAVLTSCLEKYNKRQMGQNQSIGSQNSRKFRSLTHSSHHPHLSHMRKTQTHGGHSPGSQLRTALSLEGMLSK